MRITTFFLFASLLHVSAKSLSQAVTISGKDMPLKKIFDAVYKQTGFVVFSNDRLMERAIPVSINAREIPLQEFLENVFKNQPLTFSIDSKTIFLAEKPYQQEQVAFSDSTVIPLLKGKILDSAGLPVPDVTVSVRNTKLIAVTDIQGDFSFVNVPRNATLVATNIAYQRRELKLEGRNAVTIRLYAEVKKLSEVQVVVNTGYQALIAVYLSHMGFPVAAEKMEFSVKDGLFSTINVPDSLEHGYSHFYAEVLRVKSVAEQVGASKDLVVLFDELFKGTNVKDAFDATLAITAAFSENTNCFFIISSHIIEVGEALKERGGSYQFLYLPTVMEGNVPRYTYQLQPGITADRHGMVIIENEGLIGLIRKRE